MEINWYPGHMARSRRLLQEQLRAVDAVVELCDARAPLATRNPDLNQLTRGKARLLVLNKADLADDNVTAAWLKYFRAREVETVRFNSNGARAREILSRIEEAVRPAMEKAARRGVRKTARLMVIGIPNVGKSTFINRINGSPIAKAADRPGHGIEQQDAFELRTQPHMKQPFKQPRRAEQTHRCKACADIHHFFTRHARDQRHRAEQLQHGEQAAHRQFFRFFFKQAHGSPPAPAPGRCFFAASA